jgi:putative ABC transport system permease protein
VLISLAACVGGTIFAVRRAVKQPPAEAMRPEAPARYRRTWFDRTILAKAFSEPTRMIARNLQRRPMKALSTSFGISASFAILVMGLFSSDSIEYMLDVQYRLAERDDISVSFVEPTSYSALLDLQRLPGVDYAEGFRAVPVRLRVGHRTYRTSILGVSPGGDLYRTLDPQLKPVEPPEEGLVLTDYLAELLQVKPGEDVTVEVLARLHHAAGRHGELSGVWLHESSLLNRFMRKVRPCPARLAVDGLRGSGLRRHQADAQGVAGDHQRAPKACATRWASKFSEHHATLLAGTTPSAWSTTAHHAPSALTASLRVLGFTRRGVFHLAWRAGDSNLAAILMALFIHRPLHAVVGTGRRTPLHSPVWPVRSPMPPWSYWSAPCCRRWSCGGASTN